MTSFLRLLLTLPLAFVGLVVSLPLIAIWAIFWCFTALVRYLPHLWEPSLISHAQIIQYDPKIGWMPRPNMRAHHQVNKDDIFRIETDDHGWPLPGTTIDESNVLVFGDSYASCYGANPGSTFADFTTRDVTIKPIGAPGYNMVQELLLMKKLAPKLAGKLVVWFIYMENDLPDNLSPGMGGYRTPFIRRNANTSQWEIVTDHLSEEEWNCTAKSKDNIQTLANLCSSNPISDRIFSGCRYLISEGHQVVEEAGGTLAVMTIPHSIQVSSSGLDSLRAKADAQVKASFDPEYPDKMIGEMCKELNVPFVASRKTLSRSDYKRFETFHWTESGHKKAAELIENLYQAHTTNTHPSVVKKDGVAHVPDFQLAFSNQ